MSRRLRPLPRRRVLLYTCVALWVAAFIATHVPPVRVPTLGPGDKVLHAAGYFVLSGMFLLALSAYRAPRGKRVALVVFTMMFYAAFDELTQLLVARSADIADWLADMVGTAAAIVVCESVLYARSLRTR